MAEKEDDISPIRRMLENGGSKDSIRAFILMIVYNKSPCMANHGEILLYLPSAAWIATEKCPRSVQTLKHGEIAKLRIRMKSIESANAQKAL